MTDHDLFLMRTALEEAQAAADRGEAPIGAVLSDPDGRERWRSPGLASGRAMAVRPDGSAAAFADPAGLVVVDAATGDRIGSAAARPGVGATALAFAPDGTRLAVGWSDGRVEVVDAASGRTLGGWLAHQNQVYDVAFSPDGRLLATGAFNGGGMGNDGFDSGLRLWDAASGRQIADLAYHDAQVDTVVFSADGRWLISAGADREVLLWPAWTQWTERACAVAGRDLTEQERLAYLKAADRAVDVCGDPP